MLTSRILLLVLPLLAEAAQKRCKATAGNSPAVQALVATGGRGHRWGQSKTTSPAPEMTPTESATPVDDEEDEEEYAPDEEEGSYAPPETSPAVASGYDTIVSSPTYAAAASTAATGGAYSPSAESSPAAGATANTTPEANVPASSAAETGDAAVSPTSTSASPPGGTGVPDSSGSCECGYILSQYDNAYFPSAIVVDFSTVTDVSQLAAMGLIVVDGWRVGSVNDADGTYCTGSASNIRLAGGALEFIVPGGQTGGMVSGAELQTEQAVMGGVFTMSAQLDPGHGTCQAIFTYIGNEDVGRDEQDIEMLGQSLLTESETGVDPGIQLTNWSPTAAGENDFGIVPFTADPTAAYHNYTIAWIPGGTKYYFDGAMLTSPAQYSSVNPSKVMINNWSNGDATFTQGPPTSDVVLKVSKLAYYYQTESLGSYPAYPAGCTEAQACVV
ncbi:hypothetical protein I316_06956 [Kwoniella heveanensis BCC8398]|uniref:GH16 domain-containing protein n=1 Tax=Kwoniella heveanensis BCC8398 TaxID=1296120 RepID=A0A1B9GK24_9TREE|nr:hypothetical protein I316_06956 [Kwoniella heveanensis BCC8398]